MGFRNVGICNMRDMSMINFLMVFGLLLLVFGTGSSVVTTIIMVVKKKRKVWIAAICIPICFFLSFAMLGLGGYMYGQTDEYKELAQQQEAERQQRTEEEKQREEEEWMAQQEAEEKNLKDESEIQNEKIREIFGDANIYFVNSDFLYENSEYYAEKCIVTIINAKDISNKTIYGKSYENIDLSIYCRFESKKEIKGLSEGEIVCIAGTVQVGQRLGKAVELDDCHVLSAGDENEYFIEKIAQEKKLQQNYATTAKEQKAYDMIEMEDKYKENFYCACEGCGIDVSEVKDYKKLSDWASGERYSFYYMNNTHAVYLLDSGEIFSINYCQNTSIKLYERGYKPLNIEDFIIDVGTISMLQVAAEAVVKESCNYPNSVNFDWWTTGSYLRMYDYYVLRAEFSTNNAFGMKERHSFRIDCTYSEDGGSSLVYYELDGVAVSGLPQVPELPKEELEQDSNSENKDAIVLSYDKQGTNGQYDLFDGEPYLRYYVPPGNYTVKCSVGGGFYIETVELHKEDGWDTSDIIQQINISTGDEIEITIEDGQCISLIVNTEIELLKND